MADARLIPPSIADARTVAVLGILDRLDGLEAGIVSNLFDPALCNPAALPLMAHQLGVLDESWALATTDAAKRTLLAEAIALQKLRGTPYSLKRALAVVGWPGLAIQERTLDWAHFKLVQPLGGRSVSADDLNRLMGVIEEWKPARCILEAVELGVTFESNVSGVGPHYDGAHTHDGSILYEGLTLATLDHAKVGQGAPTVNITPITVVDQGASLLITFLVDQATANGLVLDTFAVYTAAGTLVAQATTPAVTKTAALTLAVSWTLHKI